jgi:hypothetical protein
MKRTILAAATLAVAATVPASAATLYVGHGIDGRDLGAAKALPVDVCLADGTELLGQVPFGAFASLEVPAGRYDVEVRLSDDNPGTCNGALAIAASLFLGLGENATALAHLTEQGTPTITKFTNDVRALGQGQARVVARHAAAFGDVNVYLRAGRKPIVIRGLENPDQEGAEVPAGPLYVGIYPASSWSKAAFSANLELAAGKAYFAYAVGTPAKGTFTVILQALDAN